MQLHEHLIDSKGNPKPVSVEVANACIRLAGECLFFHGLFTGMGNYEMYTNMLIKAIQHDMKEDKA